MPKCIIQFGLARVNSGPVAQALAKLDTAGFLYADLGGNANHGPSIYSMFAADPARHPHHRQRQTPPRALKAFIAAAHDGLKRASAAAGARSLILSADSMLLLTEAELRSLRARLAELGREVELRGYLRTPGDAITRQFCDRVAAGTANSIDLEALYRDDSAQLAKFDAVFGASNVAYRVFDASMVDDGGMAQDFARWVGIGVLPKPGAQDRALPARDTVALLAQLHFYTAAKGIVALKPEEARVIVKLLNDYDGQDFSLAPELLAPLLARHQSDINTAEARTGASFAPRRASPYDVRAYEELLVPVPRAVLALRTRLGTGGPAKHHADDDLGVLINEFRAGRVKPGAKAEQRRAMQAPAKTAPARPAPGKPAAKAPAQKPAIPVNVSPRVAAMLRPATVSFPASRAMPETAGPRPLVNHEKNLIVFWSAKTACTTAYVWFSHVSGFSDVVRAYASWPHRHRQEQYQKSQLYSDSIEAGAASFEPLRIIRDPYSRAVSIYRHALQTHFADKDIQLYAKGNMNADKGYSFQSFLDFVLTVDMGRVDIHFRPQRHPFESAFPLANVINISRQDLFTELNNFEGRQKLPKTNFADLDWLHHLEGKRKAKQDPMVGEALDTVPFSRQQVMKLGIFPSYNQLLTPEARQKIEAIYKADFDAYRDHL